MKSNIPLSHKLQLSYMLSQLLKLSILVLFFSIEATFILQKKHLIHHFLSTLFLVAMPMALNNYYISKPQPVYLVHLSCLKPPNHFRVPISTYIEHAHMLDFLDQKSVAFMKKVLSHSGQGEMTYLPPALHFIPPQINPPRRPKRGQPRPFPRPRIPPNKNQNPPI